MNVKMYCLVWKKAPIKGWNRHVNECKIRPCKILRRKVHFPAEYRAIFVRIIFQTMSD
jgi:hypothetical protein